MKRCFCLAVILIMILTASALGEGQKLGKKDFQTVGNIVKLGKYEQDNNKKNGQEEIEWIVLDVQQGKSLLLSRYLLDARPYNNGFNSVTWETCSLRKWLNSDFLSTAFSSDEQSAILVTAVDNSSKQGYRKYEKNGGNDTRDKIFLLSYYEAFTLYFSRAKDRMGATTAYALAKGAFTSNYKKDGKATGWWWLRSPGRTMSMAAGVYNDGDTCSNTLVGSEDICVRPALWMDLNADIF